MDELDRLRPVVAFDDTDERLVVDSFTDLPDIVIYDEDDDVNHDETSPKQTATEQVLSRYVLCFVYVISSDFHHISMTVSRCAGNIVD